jgi:hypothetical protein
MRAPDCGNGGAEKQRGLLGFFCGALGLAGWLGPVMALLRALRSLLCCVLFYPCRNMVVAVGGFWRGDVDIDIQRHVVHHSVFYCCDYFHVDMDGTRSKDWEADGDTWRHHLH